MFEINATLIIFIASFIIFMILLNKIMLEPVGRVIEAREAKIRADIEAGRSARAQSESAVNEYQSHLATIRAQAQAVINEAVEKATYHRHLEIERVKGEGQQKVAAAQAQIQNERDSALGELIDHEKDLVRSITAKLLGESAAVSVDSDNVRRALEEACSRS